MNQTRRRQFLISTGALLAARLVHAQQSGKVPKIGYLSWAEPAQDQAFVKALAEGLRERGYVEGQNIAVEYRRGPTERLAELAAELVQLKVDAFVTVGTPAARAAKQATSTIPIVITLVADPVDSGLATSLARPGGNLTGLSMFGVWGKALDVFIDTVPKVSRVAVFMDPTNLGHVAGKKDADAAARFLRVTVQHFDVRTAADLDAPFAAMRRQQVDAFYVFPLRETHLFPSIIEFALKNRVPTLMINKERVKEGALMSYTIDFEDPLRASARFIDRILKGAKPADLPIEQPTKFELAINLKTARAIGLVVPQSVLLRVNNVFDQ